MKAPRRIAMWSGPRNISTAMMRAWGSRQDTVVADEPFYAHYLQHTGCKHHPGYQDIIAHHETDWQQVVAWLTGPLPENKTVFYQKQMAHHLPDHISLDWTESLTNVFLIRSPREMLLSLLEFFPNPTLEETALPQQLRLFQRERQRTGLVPPVLDAKAVLLDPRGMLEQLCTRINVPFDECMLSWERGTHETDGIWSRYWYQNVAASTTFSPYRARSGELPARHRSLLEKSQELYRVLERHRLQLPNRGRK